MDREKFKTQHSIRSAEFKAAVYEAWNEDEAIVASCVEKLIRSETCDMELLTHEQYSTVLKRVNDSY